MLSAEAARLIDDLEVAHQDVKRAYLAWCPTQAGLVENGVGSDNNGRTSDFLKRERCAALGQVTRLRNSIIRSSKELDRRWCERYTSSTPRFTKSGGSTSTSSMIMDRCYTTVGSGLIS